MNILIRSALIIRYAVAGGSASLLELMLLYTFTEYVHLPYLVSASIAISIAFVVRFLLQKLFAFRHVHTKRIYKELFFYGVTYIAVIGANIPLLYGAVDILFLPYMVAQVGIIIILATISFFAYRFFIFPESHDTKRKGGQESEKTRLLIITQKIDRNDSMLGFMHGWITHFRPYFKSIAVICLETGQFDLPHDIKVISLGKEKQKQRHMPTWYTRFIYAFQFYKQIYVHWWDYDAVFVHMNQEYVLLGGIPWLLGGKAVYMWRNHHAGSWLTHIAAAFCTKVFCTSRFSFTAHYPHTVLMPVGIDTDLFSLASRREKAIPRVLFFGRIAPIKRADLLIDALIALNERGSTFEAHFYGNALPADTSYRDMLLHKVAHSQLQDKIQFHNGVPHEKAPSIYASHDIFVNLSTSGMFDKTIFEAMSTGSLVLASNNNLHNIISAEYIFPEGKKDVLIEKLAVLLSMDVEDRAMRGVVLREVVVERHSLKKLANALAHEIVPTT